MELTFLVLLFCCCVAVCFILIITGEVKNLPPTHDLRRSGRDVYVVAALDQEEIFRTATVERTLK